MNKGTSAFADDGIVQKAISEIKNNFGDKISIMADVCLCQYTSSGHCGIINDKKIDNDISIETLTKIAVSQAKVGVDVVSPSAMMDGQVSAIRKGLDDADFKDVIIMSHSAKHSSSFLFTILGMLRNVHHSLVTGKHTKFHLQIHVKR